MNSNHNTPNQYVHVANGKSYTVLDAEIRLKVMGNWCDAVLYTDDLTGQKFVRTKEDFEKKFKPL